MLKMKLYEPLHCFLFFVLALSLLPGNLSRNHHLTLTNDIRRYFSVSTFGFFQGGRMSVDVQKISFNPESTVGKFGFSLTRTLSNSVTPYLESHQETCLLLDETLGFDNNVNIISFVVNTENNVVVVNCSNSFNLRITSHETPKEKSANSNQRRRRTSEFTSDSFLMRRKKRQPPPPPPPQSKPEPTPSSVLKAIATDGPLPASDSPSTDPSKAPTDKEKPQESVAAVFPDDKHDFVKDNKADNGNSKCSSIKLPMKMALDPITSLKSYSFNFDVEISEENQSGLYMLYFHNCANYGGTHTPTALNLSISINEHNEDSYLSAGEIPLPQLYFIMSVTFFCLGCGWIYVLRRKSNETFKIHYLMGLLIFVKSLSLLFHGINFYFIARDGYHIEAWAVMYYITHLLKGALLFITIVLIGTGWAFIKHILSDKDKKIFMIVIPLQVLANVAEIIMEESEEGETQHNTWREVFILVDLLCCGAILFPVVWSIRHLQDSSQTDGKALINLEKLKVFRHFYVMIVCYIYFTRIIVFLLKITVPFQYEWLDEFFREIATLVFFLVTGYKFRPTYSNPYFRLSQDDDPLEMEEVVTQSGLTEQVYKTRRSSVKEGASPNTTTKRESSHEYD